MHLASLAAKRENDAAAARVPSEEREKKKGPDVGLDSADPHFHKAEEPPVAGPSPKLVIESKAEHQRYAPKSDGLAIKTVIADKTVQNQNYAVKGNNKAKPSAKNPDIVTTIATTTAAPIHAKINTLKIDDNPSDTAAVVATSRSADRKTEGLSMMQPVDVPQRSSSGRKSETEDPPPITNPGAVRVFPNAVAAQASMARIHRTAETAEYAAASSPRPEEEVSYVPISAAKVADDSDVDAILLLDAVTDEQLDLDAKKRRRKFSCIICGLALLFVTLGVTFGVIFGIPEPDTVLTTEPTPTPSQAPSIGFIPESLISLIRSKLPVVSFDDPTSPQSLALAWMVNDPYSQTADRSDEYKLVQRFSLATLWFSMGGQDWNHEGWLDPVDECGWGSQAEDLVCDRGVVTSIDLREDGLGGSIPLELALLTKLTYLDLSFNFVISGTVPSEVGLLTDLVDFNVWTNTLTGTIPTEVGDLTKLTWLDLEQNQLSGTIPTELGRLTEMKAMGLYSNNLTGTIPSEVGRLEEIDFLSMGASSLTGTIPMELFQLRNLTTLGLSGNRLTGTLSSEVGWLTKLTTMNFGANSLSGTIPSEIGYLTELNSVGFYSNRFTGLLPLEVFLPSMGVLNLANNSLEGTIPTEIAIRSPDLVLFYVWNNSFTGTLPTELGLLTSMTSLSVSTNLLTGTVPSQLTSLTTMVLLELFGNDLVGSIPADLCSDKIDIYIDCEELSCTCCYGFDGESRFWC